MTKLVIGVMSLGLLAGCGLQDPDTIVQDSQNKSPAVTTQDAATQGSQVTVYVQNAPGREGGGPSTVLGGGSVQAAILEAKNEAGGNDSGKVDATYAQTGITLNITTGGTTPSLTGSAATTGTITPTSTLTSSPTQDVRAGVSIPVGFAMPGGLVEQTVSAMGGEGSTATLSPANKNDLETAYLHGIKSGNMTPFFDLVKELFKVPTSQPVEN
jgi:FlaG/FlaF family flagellin (archaellin)